MMIHISFAPISIQKYFSPFLAALLLFCFSPILSQDLPTTRQPDWVVDMDLPFEKLDSLAYPSSVTWDKVTLYEEVQINTISQETFVKTVIRVIDEEADNTHKFNLSYSPKDRDRKIVAVSIWKEGKEVDITHRINWDEQESREYVNNKLWESEKRISLSIDKLGYEDMYAISYLDKSLRSDSELDQGIFYRCRDSMQTRVRVISKDSLHFQAYNGFPNVRLQTYQGHLEYVAEGYAITAYKGRVPNDFLSFPFITFSEFDDYTQLGEAFRSQINVDESSEELLDELYAQLTQGLSNDSLKIQHILNYVQDTIVYQDYGLIRAYQPSWCIEGNRGDCKAKTLISIELFKRAGIEAHPILVEYPQFYSQLDSVPSYYNFDHLIMQFVFQGDTIVVDPTSEGQTDKIGAYPLPGYRKGLVIYDDHISWRVIEARNKGRIDFFDYISDTVYRKLRITGGKMEKYIGNSGIANQPSSLFDGRFRVAFDSRSATVHRINTRDADQSEVKGELYNSISQDSIVFTQKIYTSDSVTRPFITTRKNRRRSWSFSFSNREEIDTTYSGLWPLNYVNQGAVAVYDKQKVPLIAVRLDTIDTDFELKTDFGHYWCHITEDDEKIIVKQDVFISGALPYSKMEEYDTFKKEMNEHMLKVRNAILAKPNKPKKAKIRERGRNSKKKKRKARPKT